MNKPRKPRKLGFGTFWHQVQKYEFYLHLNRRSPSDKTYRAYIQDGNSDNTEVTIEDLVKMQRWINEALAWLEKK